MPVMEKADGDSLLPTLVLRTSLEVTVLVYEVEVVVL